MEGSLHHTMKGGPTGGAETAWRGLAALADWRNGRPTGEQLAEHLGRDKSAAQSALAIRNFLHEILVDAGMDAEAARVHADVSQLIEHLPSQILPAVLRTEIEENRRTEFLTAVTQRLSLAAVLRFASGLAAAFERPFPDPVRATWRKLAQRALTMPARARAEVETLLRDQLRRQFLNWTTPVRKGPSQGFEMVLEKLERRPPGRTTPEADRLLEMAIESDSLGPAVWVALHEVVEEGGIARVIDVMKTAPEDSASGSSIMRRISNGCSCSRMQASLARSSRERTSSSNAPKRFSALSASDFVLKPSAPSMVSVLPSGLCDTIEHLWLLVFCAT